MVIIDLEQISAVLQKFAKQYRPIKRLGCNISWQVLDSAIKLQEMFVHFHCYSLIEKSRASDEDVVRRRWLDAVWHKFLRVGSPIPQSSAPKLKPRTSHWMKTLVLYRYSILTTTYIYRRDYPIHTDKRRSVAIGAEGSPHTGHGAPYRTTGWLQNREFEEFREGLLHLNSHRKKNLLDSFMNTLLWISILVPSYLMFRASLLNYEWIATRRNFESCYLSRR